MLTPNQLRTKALADLNGIEEFDKLCDEFSLLDEFFKARTQQGLTQAQVAEINRNHPIWRRTNGVRQRQLSLPQVPARSDADHFFLETTRTISRHCLA